jgi:hypothetical protein
MQDILLEVHGAGLRTLEGLPAFAALEGRIVGVLLEESGERRVEVPQGHLQRLGVDLREPGQFRLDLRQSVHQGKAGEFFLSLGVGFGLLLQTPVEDKPDAPKVLFQHLALRVIWIQSELVGSEDHGFTFYTVTL